MYSAQVATLGLELYEMPVTLSGRGASSPAFFLRRVFLYV
jgi:hypothetical protein